MDTETADAGFLNARQEAFCREFVAGGSAVAAARAAGYAETTARAQAGRLLQHPNIQQRIDQLRTDEADAKAALCGRLLQDAHAIRERAIANGDDRMALQAINTTLRVVRQLGMPATPPDTQDILLDSAAEAAAAADDAAAGLPDPMAGMPDAADAEASDPDAPLDTAFDGALDGEDLDAVAAADGVAASAPARAAPVGSAGDRRAAMLAIVGDGRSDAPAPAPTSAHAPP
jgi:hypothetical protein